MPPPAQESLRSAGVFDLPELGPEHVGELGPVQPSASDVSASCAVF